MCFLVLLFLPAFFLSFTVYYFPVFSTFTQCHRSQSNVSLQEGKTYFAYSLILTFFNQLISGLEVERQCISIQCQDIRGSSSCPDSQRPLPSERHSIILSVYILQCKTGNQIRDFIYLILTQHFHDPSLPPSLQQFLIASSQHSDLCITLNTSCVRLSTLLYILNLDK